MQVIFLSCFDKTFYLFSAHILFCMEHYFLTLIFSFFPSHIQGEQPNKNEFETFPDISDEDSDQSPDLADDIARYMKGGGEKNMQSKSEDLDNGSVSQRALRRQSKVPNIFW